MDFFAHACVSRQPLCFFLAAVALRDVPRHPTLPGTFSQRISGKAVPSFRA
jgi:hypothetical protein